MSVNAEMYCCKNGDDSNDDCNDSDDYHKYGYADDEDIGIISDKNIGVESKDSCI